MKKIIEKWVGTSLILRIFVGLVLGAVLGLLVPQAEAIAILGSVFVGALKSIAPVLVFLLVASALSRAHSHIGKRFSSVIALYMMSTLIAAVVSVFASFVFPVRITFTTLATAEPPQGLAEVMRNLVLNMVTNPVSSISNANYIGVLFWAVVAGLCLKMTASENTLNLISELSNCVSLIVRCIIQCAPFGILGLVFASVSESGLEIFTDYGKLLIVLVGSMLFVALVVNPVIVALFIRRNPYPLVFKCLKESGLTAFFTRSSAANIPINMQLCERLGLEKDFYSVSIPLGATINMDGAAVTITVMTLAVCNTMGIAVDIPTAILLSVLATLGACGASGVAGGSLLLIPLACSLFGINNDIAMQAVAVGFIIGVVQDSVETALNSSGDVLFTATAEYYERRKTGKAMNYLGKSE
ncbi:MAG: serine/threonine transporter SstT [Spirochaetia bacterium]|nr:serine/threonine transporter SstT [Spirochaetia bacterium]